MLSTTEFEEDFFGTMLLKAAGGIRAAKISPWDVPCDQCDQIGQLFKVLTKTFSNKRSPTIW